MPKGVKWRGHSVYQINQRLGDANSARAAAYQIKLATDERATRLEGEAKQRLIEIAEELKGLEPDDIALGRSWDCATSPTDRCIYNETKDHWHDHCLFCDKPEDRG
jgi:hypothetical protein